MTLDPKLKQDSAVGSETPSGIGKLLVDIMDEQRNALTAATERAEQLQAECERLRVALREVADCNVHSGLGNHCTCSQRERWAIAYRAIDAASAAAAKETPK